MNGKKYFVSAMVLNTVLVAFAACLDHRLHTLSRDGKGTHEEKAMALSGPDAKFGPVMEKTLPAADATGRAEILDLETGRARPEPAFEDFNSNVRAVMGWIRSNGLDISCFVWRGGAACVTYDMNVIPVEGTCWEKTTEQELLGNPALAPGRHAPRRLLVLGDNRPDTYIFRTGEGTVGMLRIIGLWEHGQGVKIRYKLINPVKSLAVAR
jgi:hypothetical protein